MSESLTERNHVYVLAVQMTFINNIISYLTKNGMIDKAMLFEPPFTNIHQDGLIGVFDDVGARKVIQLVNDVNENALVRMEA